MLELAILGLLAEHDLHGYELKRRLGALAASASYGSLYPALNRLARRGVVRVVSDAAAPPRPDVPMTGSLDGEAAVFRQRRGRLRHSGKARKVYALTETGRSRLHELLTDDDVDDRSFGLKLAFASHLDPSERAALVDRRRQRLADDRVEVNRHRREQTDRWRRASLDRTAELIDHELGWLDTVDTDGGETTPDPTPTPTDRSTTP